MKRCIFLLIAFFLGSCNSITLASLLKWDDNQSHIIDDKTHQNDIIFLDQITYNNPGTHVELSDGGYVKGLFLYQGSSINISGGVITHNFSLHNNSICNMNGGSVVEASVTGDSIFNMVNGVVQNDFTARGDSKVTVSGGLVKKHFIARHNGTVSISNVTIEGGLQAIENGVITMSGGSVGGGLSIGENGIIYLNGTNFELNGQSLSYGDKLSDFAQLFVTEANGIFFLYYGGTVSGTLADGSSLDNQFAIFNTGYFEGTGDIIIIPEPATLLLLATGGVLLRIRKYRG